MIVIRLGPSRVLDRTAAAEERISDLIRPEIDVDAIGMNLSADDERSQQTEGSPSPSVRWPGRCPPRPRARV